MFCTTKSPTQCFSRRWLSLSCSLCLHWGLGLCWCVATVSILCLLLCQFAFFSLLMARLVCAFKSWKLSFKNIFGNTCGWKSVLKCVKCCLKTENGCLKTQTKHPLNFPLPSFSFYFLFFILILRFQFFPFPPLIKSKSYLVVY